MKTLEILSKEFEDKTGLKSRGTITDGVHVVGIEVWSDEFINWLVEGINISESRIADAPKRFLLTSGFSTKLIEDDALAYVLHKTEGYDIARVAVVKIRKDEE